MRKLGLIIGGKGDVKETRRVPVAAGDHRIFCNGVLPDGRLCNNPWFEPLTTLVERNGKTIRGPASSKAYKCADKRCGKMLIP